MMELARANSTGFYQESLLFDGDKIGSISFSVLTAAARECGKKQIKVIYGNAWWTPWWTPEECCAVATMKVAFKAWSRGTQ